MQKPRPDMENPGGVIRGKSALHQVFEAVVDLERKKVITGPADSVGVMFWNVDVSPKHRLWTSRSALRGSVC